MNFDFFEFMNLDALRMFCQINGLCDKRSNVYANKNQIFDLNNETLKPKLQLGAHEI